MRPKFVRQEPFPWHAPRPTPISLPSSRRNVIASAPPSSKPREDIRAPATQLVTRTDDTTFGENEFTLRDIIHRVAAKGLEIALEGRKKGGMTGRAGAATGAANRPGSSGGR